MNINLNEKELETMISVFGNKINWFNSTFTETQLSVDKEILHEKQICEEIYYKLIHCPKESSEKRNQTIIKGLNEEVLSIIPNTIIGDERVIYISGDKYIPSGSSLEIDKDGIVTKTIYVRLIL